MVQKTGVDLASGFPAGAVRTAYEYYVKDETWIPWVAADGVASRTVVRPLARNALVRRYTVRVGAARADGTTLDNAGQVRLQAEDGGAKIIVVDFGMLRTVSGVGRVGGAGAPTLKICSLRAFKGDGFDTTDLYFEDCSTDDLDAMMIRSVEANTFETRTDRVRIKVQATASLTQIAAALWLQFPDLPSDLDLRVNGGPAVWTAPGVAQPNTRGWDDTTHQTVDLTAALAALTGDAHDASPFDANIVLSSRIPGLLSLDDDQVDVAYLARVTFGPENGGAEEAAIALDEEGDRDIVLPLPSWVAAVQEIRFTMTGTVPPERILPPVGPPRALRSAGDGAAYDLLLDVDHSGAARLDAADPFAELTAVRLPLRAGADGVEARVVLHRGTGDGPTTPVDGGTSTPVDLPPAAADAADEWTTFPLPKPVKLDHTLTYWAVVVVGRGGASWSLGSFSAPASVVPIRRGAAIGPWHELPGVVAPGMNLGARGRAVGKAPPAAPLAPLAVSVAGHETTQIDATPAPKGASAAWIAPGDGTGTAHPSVAPEGPSSARTLTLRLTSRMTGTVKLGAVDVVAIK